MVIGVRQLMPWRFTMVVICVIWMKSDLDDLYDIASEEYVDQYNFDVPEGMDLIVFERGRGL